MNMVVYLLYQSNLDAIHIEKSLFSMNLIFSSVEKANEWLAKNNYSDLLPFENVPYDMFQYTTKEDDEGTRFLLLEVEVDGERLPPLYSAASPWALRSGRFFFRILDWDEIREWMKEQVIAK